MRILTLLVRHGTDKFPGAIDDVAALFARQFHEVEWDLIVIDNKLPEDYVEGLGSGHVLIGGSNAMREFSAWESGLAFVGQRLGGYDFINQPPKPFALFIRRILTDSTQACCVCSHAVPQPLRTSTITMSRFFSLDGSRRPG